MSMVPSHANASLAHSGNAMSPMQQIQRQMVPGVAGQNMMQSSCHFPAPPPKRCYCHPAAFTSLDGRTHQRMLDAYGNSRPCNNF